MLEIENISVSYGPIEAVCGASLRVAAGSITAIVGANGAGKSTCLKAVSGLVSPAQGRIVFEGAKHHALGRPENRRADLVLCVAEAFRPGRSTGCFGLAQAG